MADLYDEDGEDEYEDNEYGEYDDDDTEALFEELRQSTQAKQTVSSAHLTESNRSEIVFLAEQRR